MVSSVTTSETYMFLLADSQPRMVVAFTAASDQSDACGRHMFPVTGSVCTGNFRSLPFGFIRRARGLSLPGISFSKSVCSMKVHRT